MAMLNNQRVSVLGDWMILMHNSLDPLHYWNQRNFFGNSLCGKADNQKNKPNVLLVYKNMVNIQQTQR